MTARLRFTTRPCPILALCPSTGLERAWLLEQIELSEEQLGHDNPRIAGEKLQTLIALLLKQTGLPVPG